MADKEKVQKRNIHEVEIGKKPRLDRTISVAVETYEDLERLRQAASKEIGFELSWNEYFIMDMKARKEK